MAGEPVNRVLTPLFLLAAACASPEQPTDSAEDTGTTEDGGSNVEPGDACSTSDTFCFDEQNLGVCVDGEWTEQDCNEWCVERSQANKGGTCEGRACDCIPHDR